MINFDGSQPQLRTVQLNTGDNSQIKNEEKVEEKVNLSEVKLPTPESEQELENSINQLAMQNKVKVDLPQMRFVSNNTTPEIVEEEVIPPTEETPAADTDTDNDFSPIYKAKGKGNGGKKGYWSRYVDHKYQLMYGSRNPDSVMQCSNPEQIGSANLIATPIALIWAIFG